jgi:hypothetical protein
MTAAPLPDPPRPTPAAVPPRLHGLPRPLELRRTDPAPDSPAAARDRARWAECSRGAHVWIELPEHLGAAVCAHCPTRADQAARVRTARRARAGA